MEVVRLPRTESFDSLSSKDSGGSKSTSFDGAITDLEQGPSNLAAKTTTNHTITSSVPSSTLSNASNHDTEKTPITSAEDWTGPNDEGNPHNWPLWKRLYHTFVPASIALVATYASSVYTPGIPGVQTDLHVSAEVARIPFVVFVLGLMFGGPIASPCSEAFGRKPVYLVFIPLFMLFVLGTGLSNDIASLTICRFFAGVFSSPAISIGSGTIADVWPVHKRSIPMSFYLTSPLLGPALGPLIGSYVTVALGWRWTSWTVEFFAIAFMLPTIFMSETYKKSILDKRAKRLNIAGPSSPTTGLSQSEKARYFLRTTLIRPIHMLFTEAVVVAFGLYTSFVFALLYAFFAVFPHIFQQQYGFDTQQVGLTFIGVGTGSVLGLIILIIINKPLQQRVRQHAIKKSGLACPDGVRVTPEQRLYIAMLGSLFVPPALFLFGWSAQYKVHWIVPVIGAALYGIGILMVFQSAIIYVTDVYGARYAASAMAANTFLRYIIATALPLFAVQMFEAMGIGAASSLLGGIAVVLALIPWVFHYFGPQLRRNSKYAEPR